MFQIWVIVFGMVGAQMSWILRPFIGGGNDFAWFRPRGSNFFQAVYLHIHHLFGM
jgi:apolipoprotein N-acyltransferase